MTSRRRSGDRPAAGRAAPALRTALRVVATPGTALVLRVDNPGDATARFCVYQTPFEGFAAPFLDILAEDGAPVRYEGAMVKRAPPDASDWRTLAPGEAAEASFDPSAAYSLPPGTYQVRFRGGPASGLPASEPVRVVVAELATGR